MEYSTAGGHVKTCDEQTPLPKARDGPRRPAQQQMPSGTPADKSALRRLSGSRSSFKSSRWHWHPASQRATLPTACDMTAVAWNITSSVCCSTVSPHTNQKRQHMLLISVRADGSTTAPETNQCLIAQRHGQVNQIRCTKPPGQNLRTCERKIGGGCRTMQGKPMATSENLDPRQI